MSEATLQPSSSIPVAIVGAGPYGLSVAANLRAQGVEYRIFGQTMRSWLENMPEKMFLKSVGFASSLSDGTGNHTLAAYCRAHGREYRDIDWPVSNELFTDYAQWFQKTLVDDVEPHEVTSVKRSGSGFELYLSTGENVYATRVVMAVGHTYFAYTPVVFRGLPDGLVSHAMDHRNFESFAGRSVTVIGAGQSALETAALLHEAGAEVNVLVRENKLAWNGDPVERSLRVRLRAPESGLGPGWKSLFYSKAPQVFRHLPRALREEVVRRALGPAGAWWLKPRVLGKVAIGLGTTVRSATAHGDGLQLELDTGGETRRVTTDHVIVGTGYRVDINRIPFVARDLLAGIRQAGTVPVLNGAFESSVPGLYFVGLSAAATFGPVQRFVYGADFAARRVSRHVARGARGRRSADIAARDGAVEQAQEASG